MRLGDWCLGWAAGRGGGGREYARVGVEEDVRVAIYEAREDNFVAEVDVPPTEGVAAGTAGEDADDGAGDGVDLDRGVLEPGSCLRVEEERGVDGESFGWG